MSTNVGDPRPETVRESSLGGLRTLVVSPRPNRATVVLALRGATLLSWRVAAGGAMIELIDGFVDEEEFRREDGMRSATMAPFSNRIGGSRYVFDGQKIAFAPNAATAGAHVMHGLLRDQDFEVVKVTENEATTTVELVSRSLRPGSFEGYPFSVDVSVTYTVSADTVEVVSAGTNVGVEPAPYAFGWHPYFRIGDADLATTELRIPARTRVLTHDDLIPLDGSAAFKRIGGADDPFDFREPRPVGDLAIDVCYVDLESSSDGLVRTTVSEPSQSILLNVWQERGSVHVYTGDALAREPRRSLAVEPVEALTNAFNRADQADLIRLEPGATRSFRFGATAHARSIACPAGESSDPPSPV